MKTLELYLPDWMASALVNGDTSSLSLDDDGGEESERHVAAVEAYVTAQGFFADSANCQDDTAEFFNSPPLDSVRAYGETLGGEFALFTFYGPRDYSDADRRAANGDFY